jgi:acetolactate synthase I/II/III large subunit
VARACSGIEGIRVDRPEQLKPALERAFGSKGPVLLDVIMDRDVSVPAAGYWDILDIYKY